MKAKPILSIFTLLCLSACASVPQEPLRAEIQGKTKEQVAERVASLCQDYGFNVDAMQSNNILCSKVTSMMGQFLFKTNSGANVESKLKFTLLSPTPNTIRVTPQTWFESMNAYGGVKKYPATPQNDAVVRLIFQDLERY